MFHKHREAAVSILAVTLVLSLLSLSIVGVLMLGLTNRSLSKFEESILAKEFDKTEAVTNVLNRDIDILHTMIYRQLSDNNLLKIILYLNDNSLNMQYRESVTNTKALLFSLETALDIVTSANIYLPEHQHIITSQSATIYGEDTTQWLDQIIEKETSGVFIDDRQLLFIMADQIGAETDNDNVIFITEVYENIIADYLHRFAKDDTGAIFALLVKGQDASTLFAQTDNTALAKQMNDDIAALIADTQQGMEILAFDAKEYLITWGSTSLPSLIVCQITPMATLNEQLNEHWRYLVFGYTLSMLIIVVLIAGMNFLIQKPLLTLRNFLKHIESGDFSARIGETWSMEFQLVYDQFNSMAEHTQRLIEHEYELRVLNTKAELKQMQYQISPHFLYNTYFIMRGMLADEEYEQAEHVSNLMGRYLRYITSANQDYATLQNEYDHALAYMNIQQIRFQNRVEIRYDACPPEFAQLNVPKLIIQPLIENAFEHGIKHQSGKGIVYLHFEHTDDTLSVIVEDNGDMATDRQIEYIQQMLAREVSLSSIDDGVALININKRLRIIYQNDSQLKVGRSSLGGFCATIIIQGVIRHVPNANR